MPTGISVGPDLRVSFQRYPRPSSGVLDAPPRSWGALLVAPRGAAEFLVPVADDEAVWLGLSCANGAADALVDVVVETSSGAQLDAVTGLAVPPASALDGISRQEGGWWPFTRLAPAAGAPACRAISMTETRAAATCRIVFVEPQRFADETGLPLPEPLSVDAIYGGWRLP